MKAWKDKTPEETASDVDAIIAAHVSCRCTQVPLVEEPSKDCTCDRCVGACKQNPGWFAPGEAEKAAEHLGTSFEIFQAFLIKDHADNPDVNEAPYVWAPRKIGVDKPDEQIRTWAHQRAFGTCVFLKEDRCIIHAVKPYECRKAFACNFKHGNRDRIEEMYRDAKYPLGERPYEGYTDDAL